MRPMLALIVLATLTVAGGAQAGDWEVARGAQACEAQVALKAGSAVIPLVVSADGQRRLVQIAAPAGVSLTRLAVDGRAVAFEAQRVGDRLEGPLTEELAQALAKGVRVRATWSQGRAGEGSLIGSAKALAALSECGEALRLARLAPPKAQEPEIVDASTVTAANETDDSPRSAAIAEARVRYQREVLATIGAGVLGAGGFAPEPRSYDFPGVGTIVCSASLESFDCR